MRTVLVYLSFIWDTAATGCQNRRMSLALMGESAKPFSLPMSLRSELPRTRQQDQLPGGDDQQGQPGGAPLEPPRHDAASDQPKTLTNPNQANHEANDRAADSD